MYKSHPICHQVQSRVRHEGVNLPSWIQIWVVGDNLCTEAYIYTGVPYVFRRYESWISKKRLQVTCVVAMSLRMPNSTPAGKRT